MTLTTHILASATAPNPACTSQPSFGAIAARRRSTVGAATLYPHQIFLMYLGARSISPIGQQRQNILDTTLCVHWKRLALQNDSISKPFLYVSNSKTRRA
jgi:hypothetical protein